MYLSRSLSSCFFTSGLISMFPRLTASILPNLRYSHPYNERCPPNRFRSHCKGGSSVDEGWRPLRSPSSPNISTNNHTSISILSSADDNDFPSASLLSERDAPPSSAPCSTKLSASTLEAS